MITHRKRRAAERGYSLSELLVVVAIIGIISLVTVPQFLTYANSLRLKSSMRQFVNDLRFARQKAVARHTLMKIAFSDPGSTTNVRNYTVAEWNQATSTWTQVTNTRSLQSDCFITGITNISNRDADAAVDVVFRPDGTVQFDSGVTTGTVTLRTTRKVAVPQYTIDVNYAGFIKSRTP